MGKRSPYRAVLTRVCLVAMAIQGMSPDAQDLASPVLARILRAITAPDGLDCAHGGVLPPPGPGRIPSQDETPDEVCAPVSAAARVAVRAPEEGRSHLGLMSATPAGPPDRANVALPSHLATSACCRERLSLLLCRLTC